MSDQKGECKDWSAWHDRQPVEPATLHVVGKCNFTTSGYKVELKPASPQGINPKIYILQKIVTPPRGASNDVLTIVSVQYNEKTNAHYDQVLIVPDNVTVPVKEVS
jgi:hypothetical protein